MTPTVELLRHYAERGVLFTSDAENKRLMILDTAKIAAPIPVKAGTVLVVYEGEGAYFWDKTTAMNTFVLIQHGFSGNVASTLSGLLNEIKRAEQPEQTLSITHETKRERGEER